MEDVMEEFVLVETTCPVNLEINVFGNKKSAMVMHQSAMMALTLQHAVLIMKIFVLLTLLTPTLNVQWQIFLLIIKNVIAVPGLTMTISMTASPEEMKNKRLNHHQRQ